MSEEFSASVAPVFNNDCQNGKRFP